MDLKSWFHHLQMAPTMRRWMRFRVGEKAFEVVGMPFGWSMSPWWSTKLAKPIRAWLNDQGVPHLWYIDDVFVLGSTRIEAEERRPG